MSEEKYRFHVDWFDPSIKVKRKFLLNFYPSDRSVDMYDMNCKRTFLRRMKCDTVDITDLFVGSIINILSRQLYIVGFADKNTAEKFAREIESCVIIINESGFSYLGKIISVVEANELSINRGKIIDKEKTSFNSSSFFENLKNCFAVLEVRGPNAKNVVRKLLNPDAPIDKPLAENLGKLSGHCVGPKDSNAADQEIKIFFPASKEVHCNTIINKDSTCCLIKPHAVREKVVGKIIQDILDAGFKISALEVVTFNQATAVEFLDVYKGVVSEYKGMVSQLMSGPCVALEIIKENTPKLFSEFRTFVGPPDPEIARKLRPGTLRATYAIDKVKNAVHCTDLPEDATLELDYVFKVLPA